MEVNKLYIVNFL